jgi:hypothetical protein
METTSQSHLNNLEKQSPEDALYKATMAPGQTKKIKRDILVPFNVNAYRGANYEDGTLVIQTHLKDESIPTVFGDQNRITVDIMPNKHTI